MEFVAAHGADVHPVHENASALRVVEPHEEVHERRLAGARWSDDGRHRSRLDDDVHILEKLGAVLVAEHHLLELHFAARFGKHLGIGAQVGFVFLVEQLVDALRRGERALSARDGEGKL